MKQLYISLLILVLAFSLSATEIITKTLDNGMTVVVKQNTSNQSVGLYCYVKTGAMHEGKYLGSGISHYLEHVVSSGSTKMRTEKEYQELSKQMGAYINAFTNQVCTAYHITAGVEYFTQALQILSEQMQYCKLDSFEVAREQQVIAKEIVRGSTSPGSKIYQSQNALNYANTNLRYPIIGKSDLFMKLTREDLLDYYQTRYVPNNMIFVVVGNIDPQEAMQAVETAFASFEQRSLEPLAQPTQPLTLGKYDYYEEFEIQLPRVSATQIIPSADIRDCYALNAAIELLLEKETSPVNHKLYKELQLVNYVYAYTYIDNTINSAALTLGFEAKETKQIPRILEIFYQEMAKYQKGYFSQKQLDNLISRYEAESYLKSRSIDDESYEIGNSMIRYGVPDYSKIIMDNLKSLKPSDLNRVVQKYFTPMNKLSFYALPIGDKALLETGTQKQISKTEIIKTELGNGLSLLYKQNTSQPIVHGSLLLPGSVYYETENNAGYLSFMAEMLGNGSKKYPKTKLVNWLEDHSASFSFELGNASLYLNFACMSKDLPELLKRITDAINNPVFSEQEIQLLKQESATRVKRSQSNASIRHEKFRSKSIYSSRREQLSLEEADAGIQKISRKDLLELHAKYLKAKSARLALSGDISIAEAKEVANRLYNAFPHSEIADTVKPAVLKQANGTFAQEYSFEQSYLDINMSAPLVSDADYTTMLVIDAVLNHGAKRIHQATRGVRDLVYSAGFSFSATRYFAFARLSGQTTREKTEALKEVLLAELDRLINEPVSQKEITEAIDDYVKLYSNIMDDESLLSFAMRHEENGLGYDFLSSGAQKLRQVSPNDIQRVAKKYFSDRDVIISVPSAEVKRLITE